MDRGDQFLMKQQAQREHADGQRDRRAALAAPCRRDVAGDHGGRAHAACTAVARAGLSVVSPNKRSSGRSVTGH